MAPRTTTAAASEAPAKKTKAKGGGGKKLTAYNRYMKVQLAKLKEDEPDMTHAERFKLATGSWKNAPENPKKSS
ncbi:hypothetical protein BT96DRAFT_913365 [Gymnopus androsaceus JB14]|uniref:YABBY protein C-terminal domain-containing protein n=1 Tax=Gymnopus androsaceus JB14 TaxID=1447944 RepID=A0A6A4IAM5_9AGAR|nr:hypothetical protein BT96DRAFT_913365 [Gymnopus androsaceus JB14]